MHPKVKEFLCSCVIITLTICFCAVGVGATEKRIIAFCGSASKPVLEEAAESFYKQTGIRVDLNLGGSGTMLSQIKLSRRGDVYIPGSPDYMIKAIRDGVVDPDSVVILAYLIIAIDVQHNNPKDIQTLSDLTRPDIRVAIGNPEAVCVGLYAVEVLEQNGLLQQVQKNIVTHAPSCEATASLLVMKKVDAVIGWDVFSKWNPDKIDAVLLKPHEITRIAYIPAAVSTYSQEKKSAQRFINFLASAEGQKIFAKWGYIATEKEARTFAPKAQIGGEYKLPKGFTTPVQR
ncbi:MAG: molybdate ABC transporter substrate-binding protein [Deltaproteobacteria bacterium RBG_13_52_11]|nr:MAG: molybdate ABC transporter substrate-binding protein [Deltaproteobacteria bacterium RBG_13_52_11]